MSPTLTSQETFARYKRYSTDIKRYYRIPAVQTSLSVVLSLFICAFFIFAAIRPTLVTITKLNKTIQESEKTLEQLHNKSAALEKISSKWNEFSPLQKYLDNSIPTQGPDYEYFAKAIELLAIENGVTLTSVAMDQALTYSKIIDPYTGNNRTVVEIPITMRISGDYPKIRDFFDKLGGIDRVVTVKSLGFAKDVETSKNENGIAFTMTGTIGYLADEKLLNKVLDKPKKEE